MTEKLLIIGLDGATFAAIIPLIKKGKIPTLKKIMKEGVFGNLESSVPPVSCPAWPSFMTGKNPKKHRVLDWFKYDKNYMKSFNSAKEIKGKRFWDYLNNQGLFCGTINVPITYPPYPIKGFMISGFLALKEDSEFTYPPELKQELLERGYMIDPVNRYSLSDESFLKKMREVMEMRKNIILYLIKNKKWDVLVAVFRPEPIQHRFWKEDTMDVIDDTYERLDGYIKEILETVSKDTNIMIISDHGFGDMPDYNIYFNTWLSNKGFFLLKQTKKKIPLDKIYRILVKMGLKWTKYLVGHKLDKLRFINYEEDVDWKNTKAFARISENIGFIYLNKENRFEEGILSEELTKKVKQEIEEELKKFEVLGIKVVNKILDKNEIYGDIEEAPDIIFEVNKKFKGMEILDKKEFVEIPNKDKRGWHSQKGIFMANGKDILNKGEIKAAKLIDIAPTILKLYGIEKPGDMDGKVLNIFKKSDWKNERISYKKKEIEKEEKQENGFSKEEEKEIKERLRSLGYL